MTFLKKHWRNIGAILVIAVVAYVFIMGALAERRDNSRNPRDWSEVRHLKYNDSVYVVNTKIDSVYIERDEPNGEDH